jgi:hypothetical protein|tara:strand:- start:1327 stop:1539 length:213 start_codon:yes stop_codon:yes gene_type:complete
MSSNENAGGGIKVLSFLIPLLGLILYLVWKDEKPVASKQVGKAALWGFGIGVVLYLISMALFVSTVGSYY